MTSTAINGAAKWVLVPGTLCTNDVFAPLLDELGVAQSACRFLTADAADVRDYDSRLREAVTGGEIVCGFSLGALILAHNLGALKKARAVVLLAVNPFPDPADKRAKREKVRDRVLLGGARDWISENWTVMSASARHDLREFVASMAGDTAHLIAVQTELAASRPGAQEDLLNTDLPLIFVTGSDDRQTPPDLLAATARKARNAQFSVLQDLGHFALIEAPDRVARVIQDGFDALGLTTHEKEPGNAPRKHSSVTS